MSIESREHTQVEAGSSRSFGIVFSVVFAAIGLYPLLSSGEPRLWALAVSVALLAASLFIPGVLQPLNLLWFRFGMLLSRVVNPIVMLLIYVLTVIPIGIGMRLAGKDLLKLNLEPEADSYWIDRAPPGPEPESLQDLF